MKNIEEALLRCLCITVIPFFMFGYALYGFRVWCWNFVHSSTIKGNWKFNIPKK
jgi:hypothetical protein